MGSPAGGKTPTEWSTVSMGTARITFAKTPALMLPTLWRLDRNEGAMALDVIKKRQIADCSYVSVSL